MQWLRAWGFVLGAWGSGYEVKGLELVIQVLGGKSVCWRAHSTKFLPEQFVPGKSRIP